MDPLDGFFDSGSMKWDRKFGILGSRSLVWHVCIGISGRGPSVRYVWFGSLGLASSGRVVGLESWVRGYQKENGGKTKGLAHGITLYDSE